MPSLLPFIDRCPFKSVLNQNCEKSPPNDTKARQILISAIFFLSSLFLLSLLSFLHFSICPLLSLCFFLLSYFFFLYTGWSSLRQYFSIFQYGSILQGGSGAKLANILNTLAHRKNTSLFMI